MMLTSAGERQNWPRSVSPLLPAHPGAWLSGTGDVLQAPALGRALHPTSRILWTDHTQGAGKRVLAAGEPSPRAAEAPGAHLLPRPWDFGQSMSELEQNGPEGLGADLLECSSVERDLGVLVDDR